ncbi:hypothetical protein [Microcoleus sp. T3_B1]|uniref:hypothetical protein n=1 Tax=Microcoleus sp. T3_B1 TaxID=3055425 RepID=UPI002FD0EF3D
MRAQRTNKDELCYPYPGFDLCEFWVGIGSGGDDRSQLQAPKEGDWRWIKVKIDTGAIELCL